MVLSLYRLICLLLLSVLGHGDVLQASTPESYTSPTDQPYLEDTSALTVSPTTIGTTNAVTDAIPSESSTPLQPDSDTSETTEAPATQQPSTTTEAASEETNPTTVSSTTTTPELTNATTAVPTNATTIPPTDATTPVPTNATTVPPTNATTPVPTNATTVPPTNATTPVPTNATTPVPTNATTPVPTNATTPVPTNATTPVPTNATTPVPTNATTPVPTNATTPLPTNETTALPTNATTPVHNVTTASTPAPTTLPPLPNPTVGNYTVKPDPKSSACLMAKMGLQFSLKNGSTFQTVNLDPSPNVTKTSGTCGSNGSDSTLLLTSDKITVQFVFTNQLNKFHLSELDITINTETGKPFTAHVTNLSLWEASLGSSYMCQKEQSYNITEALLLNTFELQVQPFNVTENKFSTAHECSVDDISLLIPIIVGAALAGLIVVVLIAYVIGRRKTYVGYQTL
ncbi:lysosome-associated membrane glycoprotein 2 [Trichomycterus rosablanca]|uniref:lysosome-associated membrane glycoprotein 2 n=1 Tax=Trichomycterus rosablanca TaxID=2290929 RepID=UPI002F3554E7